MIGFNRPFITGKEFEYIQEAIRQEKLSGNGFFTKKCHEFFLTTYGFPKVLLTQSCTSALEMAALLIRIQPGDEVIVPSYTFVSTANAFILQGAKVVFADSNPNNPNVDAASVASLITDRTKAIIVVHYAGVACDMDAIMKLAQPRGIYVVEDAAQAIDSFYKGRRLGSIAHLSAFSFHETKNIISGEGGMLVINDPALSERSEVIWEKGTNRSAFFRGEVDKYTWIDIGSSYLPSELTAAFLYAQLECIDSIQERRKSIWARYAENFSPIAGKVRLPFIDDFATNNAHMFYLVTANAAERDRLLSFCSAKGIQAIFHYQPLHKSPFYKAHTELIPSLPNAEAYGDGLIRVPFYVELSTDKIDYISQSINSFFTR
jgi:dTDP-4-amino-4,6-dideoxygalactose transaminase